MLSSYLYSYGGVNMDKKKKYTLVSLFSGAGGLDMGFENKGFQTIWANDIDKDSCKTHEGWSKAKVVQGDIGALDFSDIPTTPTQPTTTLGFSLKQTAYS